VSGRPINRSIFHYSNNMSAHSSPTRVNSTTWYPRDQDDRLLFAFRDVTICIAAVWGVIGVVIVVSSWKHLCELRAPKHVGSQKNLNTREKVQDSLLLRLLKSKYATTWLFFAVGVLVLLGSVNVFVISYYVADEVTCTLLQGLMSVTYTMFLWTTYLLFEIRRASTGTCVFKGTRYAIAQAVRWGTMGMPIFSIFSYFGTSGIYVDDAQHCLHEVGPTVSAIAGLLDGMLSIVSPPCTPQVRFTR
jgi:hypothetical protein